MNNKCLTHYGGAFLIMLLVIAFLNGTELETAFASEYGSSERITANSGITPAVEFSGSPSNSNAINTVANQQNNCKGNIVICQNILAKFICTERAVCIIGNLDPFLLVLPK